MKEGLIISVNFEETSEVQNVFLQINPTGPIEQVSINLNQTPNDRIIGFVKDNIYQLIRYQNKWILYNAEIKANYKDNGYGVVRVTGESADVSSFNVVLDTEVDLNDDKYQYDGNQFELSITLKVTAQSYILARNSYFSQEGTFGIVAKGSFSLENSSDVNPYGMRIHRMKFSPMVKNTSVGVQ